MTVKKVLAALGIVCVVAPAALAASMIMNRSSGGSLDQPARGVVEAMLASLMEMTEGSRDVGAGKIPQGAGPGIGVGALPIRTVDVLVPNLDYLKDLDFGGGDGALDDVIATSLPGGGSGATGGAVATQASGARQTGSPGAPSFAAAGAGGGSGGGVGGSGGGVGGSGGGVGGSGIGGIGGGGGSGLGVSGSGATDLALVVDTAEPSANVDAAAGETIVATPLPASVWMLMASMVGLAFIGFRRRSSS